MKLGKRLTSESSSTKAASSKESHSTNPSPEGLESDSIRVQPCLAELDQDDKTLELLSFTDQSRLIIKGSWGNARVDPWPISRPPTSLFTTTPMGQDHRYLCWPAWSIYAALTSHGMILGLTCDQCVADGLSSPEYDNLPPALKPSPLQLVTLHCKWIDRFPFPRMRDNMILLSGVIDLDQFCADMFGMASFTLKDSCPSWDPRSWILGAEFGQKWGYLLR